MKLCVIGSGPWPLEPGAIVTGPSIRLRQFVEPLCRAGHGVSVVLLEESRRASVPVDGAVGACALPPEEILDPVNIKKSLRVGDCEAVLGVGSLMPATAAANLATHLNKPCWIDLFGDPLSELHASQVRAPHSLDFPARDHIWKLLRIALLRGDAFSVVSVPQRYALLGQLGLLGRYRNESQVGERVAVIPCGVPEEWTEWSGRPAFPRLLREAGVDEGAAYVVFSGSWNVWLDEGAMAGAVSEALFGNPNLCFVSCGVSVGPGSARVRSAFLEAISASADLLRVLELPLVKREDEEAILSHAVAGLCLDRHLPESELGSRNRLLPMVRWGARPVVTLECDLARELVGLDLASGVPTGSSEAATRELLALASRSREEREQSRRRGLEWLRSVTFTHTLEAVLAWISKGAPRWTPIREEGLVDRWASLPADPEHLFGRPGKSKRRFGLL